VGTGALPEGPDVEVLVLDVGRQPSATEQFRAEERLFAEPPPAALDAIARFARAPVVLGPPFAAVQRFGPHPLFGARRPEWVEIEDKTVIDALFDEAGVPRPPSEVVAVAGAELDAAAARLDRGSGTVWSGDARDGFNGGTEFVRWVRDAASRRDALDLFAAKCERVRVAPFVEGIPCSIHGFVTNAGVAVLRPVELVTLRVDEPRGLRYAGAATYFDPPDELRAGMRAAAARVGARLRAAVGFRGPFTVDGICSREGWVATECNPRGGAGLGYVPVAAPELLFAFATRLATEGLLEDLDVRALEECVLDGADHRRWGGAWTATSAAPTTNTTIGVTGGECGYRAAASDADVDGTITFGPSPLGGFVRFEPAEGRLPRGPSFAPHGVAAFACADAALATGIGPVRAAQDVWR
jgi:hypothetical protein